jgi:ABC-type nitrate/sulfonate/bicarbonate transport system ATPase subunit
MQNATGEIMVLQLKNIYFKYKKTKQAILLENFNLHVEPGGFVCLVGASGIGKTTLLKLFAGLLKPQAGEIRRATSRIGYVFQEPRLLPWCTAEDNIALGMHAYKWSQEDLKRRLAELISRLKLQDYRLHYPSQLSGGMSQRVAIGRAFAIEPDLLLMDEPFSALDEHLKQQMRTMLKRLIQWQACTTVFVTHDIKEAMLLADRIIVLRGQPCRIEKEFWIPSYRGKDRGKENRRTDPALETQILEAMR